jgi:hypothetical protein
MNKSRKAAINAALLEEFAVLIAQLGLSEATEDKKLQLLKEALRNSRDVRNMYFYSRLYEQRKLFERAVAAILPHTWAEFISHV